MNTSTTHLTTTAAARERITAPHSRRLIDAFKASLLQLNPLPFEKAVELDDEDIFEDKTLRDFLLELRVAFVLRLEKLNSPLENRFSAVISQSACGACKLGMPVMLIQYYNADGEHVPEANIAYVIETGPGDLLLDVYRCYMYEHSVQKCLYDEDSGESLTLPFDYWEKYTIDSVRDKMKAEQDKKAGKR